MIGAIERWAERDPDVRYALLIVAIFIGWGLAGAAAPAWGG